MFFHIPSHALNASLAFVVPSSKREVLDPDADPHHSRLTIDVNDMQLIGDVRDCDAIIVDDMIDTGSRICKCAELLRNSGARRIFAFCTHGLFSGDAHTRIAESPLTEVVVTNTIPVKDYQPKIRHLSVSGLLAECIRRIHGNEAVSGLYVDPKQ